MPVYRALYRGTEDVAPKTVSNLQRSLTVNNLDLQYDPKQKVIIFSANVNSASGPGVYSCLVSFKHIEPTEGLTEEEILKGFQPKPNLGQHEIEVWCNCPNYRFRFDKANRQHGAGTGDAFPVYHRKTDRAPNNPNNLPGVCTHLIEFIDYLQRQGFIH